MKQYTYDYIHLTERALFIKYWEFHVSLILGMVLLVYVVAPAILMYRESKARKKVKKMREDAKLNLLNS